MNLSFSTKGLDARLRPQYWNEVVCSYCVPAHSRIDSPQDFNGTFSARQIGDLVVSSMSAPQHKWERTATHMRRDPNETFLLSLMKSGTGQISQFGRSTSVGKGDIVLYDAERPFSYALAPESILLLRIPRRKLLYRAPLADRYTAVRFRPDKPITSLLSNMIQEAARLELADDLPPSVAMQFADSLYDLLGAAIQVQMAGDMEKATQRNRVLELAKSYIESNLDDPTLTVERIATAVKVSERTLSRIFAESGITPMRWVWLRRLEAARLALVDGHMRRVTDVAFRYGFSDVSHFSRMFRQVYGRPPRDLLHSAT